MALLTNAQASSAARIVMLTVRDAVFLQSAAKRFHNLVDRSGLPYHVCSGTGCEILVALKGVDDALVDLAPARIPTRTQAQVKKVVKAHDSITTKSKTSAQKTVAPRQRTRKAAR